MSRSKTIRPRQTEKDPKYNSRLVAKLVNRVMKSGKKTVAQKQVYAALESLKKGSKSDPIQVLEDALKNITPSMEVRSRRVGGAAYQVPMPVKPRRGTSLSLRWLVQEANKRSNKEYHSFSEKLAAEINDALKGEGGAFQKKINAHKMAEANKAFAHFRW